MQPSTINLISQLEQVTHDLLYVSEGNCYFKVIGFEVDKFKEFTFEEFLCTIKVLVSEQFSDLLEYVSDSNNYTTFRQVEFLSD